MAQFADSAHWADHSPLFAHGYALHSVHPKLSFFSFPLDWDHGELTVVEMTVTVAGLQRTLNVLHNSEQPASCFAVLDTGTCLTADLLFGQLMQKLQHVYPVRKNTRVECKGQRYELGDFLIKVGSVGLGQNQNFRGILVEVCTISIYFIYFDLLITL